MRQQSVGTVSQEARFVTLVGAGVLACWLLVLLVCEVLVADVRTAALDLRVVHVTRLLGREEVVARFGLW